MKYASLLEKMKDPIFYAEFSKKRLARQRRYYANPQIVEKKNLCTADWKFRMARGLPTRPRIKRKPDGIVIAKTPIAPMAAIQPMVFSCTFD